MIPINDMGKITSMNNFGITPEPIIHVDLTPDDDLAYRILRTYRKNCDSLWVYANGGDPSPLIDAMNQAQAKRAKILDKALKGVDYMRDLEDECARKEERIADYVSLLRRCLSLLDDLDKDGYPSFSESLQRDVRKVVSRYKEKES